MMIGFGDDSTDGTIQLTWDPTTSMPTDSTPGVLPSALPLCAAMLPLPCGFVGPVNCDYSQGGPAYQSCGTGSSSASSSSLTGIAVIGIGIALALSAFKVI